MLSLDIRKSIANMLVNSTESAQLLDEGGFGAVYKVDDLVVKKLELQDSDLDTFKKEVSIWSTLSTNPELAPYLPEFKGYGIKKGTVKPELNYSLANTDPEKYTEQYKKLLEVSAEPDLYGFIFQTYVPVMGMDVFLSKFDSINKFDAGIGFKLFNNLVSAFELLHAAGYVHRDVKPGNILIRIGEGNDITKPLIIDFGLACKMPCDVENESLSNNYSAVGTPLYLPQNMLTLNDRYAGLNVKFPVKAKERCMLNKIKNTIFCRRRQTRKSPNSVKVKTKNIKVKGVITKVVDDYALGLVLEELYNVIYWENNKAEKLTAKETIARHKGGIIPYLAAQTAEKFSSA